MTLLKTETICPACEEHYILVFHKNSLNNLSCCPFCTTPIEVGSEAPASEEDE